MPDILAVDERNAASLTVLRYQGTFTPVTLSAAFGVPLAGGGDDHCPRNRLFVFDTVTLYFVNYNGLWKSTDSGATFTLNKTFVLGGLAGTTDQRMSVTGIHLAFDNGSGTLYLTGARLANTNSMIGWRLNLTTDVLTETDSGNSIANNRVIGDEILFNNVLHINVGTGTAQQLISWDPINQSWASFVAPFTVTASTGFSVLDDGNLYLIGAVAVGTAPRLARFTGTWTDLFTFAAYGVPVIAESDEQRFDFFTDPATGDAAVFTLISDGASVGWNVTRLPPPFDGTGSSVVQATVLAGQAPLLTIAGGGSGTNVGDKRILVIVDTETTSGTTTIILAFADNATNGTPFSFYQWNGFGLPITFIGTGGNVHNGFSVGVSGGHRFYVAGQLSVRFVAPFRVGVAGGQELSFIASGGGSHTVRFRKAKNGQDTDGGKAKLIAPVTGGGALGTDEVTGVNANGTQVNTVVWDLTNDTPIFASGEANTVLVPEVV